MTRSLVARGAVALLGITLLFAGSTRSAQTAGPDEIHVGRAVSTAFAFAALEVGVDAHIWDKVGLKLDISSFNGDAQVQQAMTAGQIDFGLGGGPAMGYHAKGVPGIAVASMYGPPTDMAIVISSNGGIKNVNDFKGKKLGVTTAGSLTDWLVHAMASRQGWGPDGIDSIAMGATETRIAALQSGQIQGSVQDIGVGYELESQGKGKVFSTFGNFVPKFETHVIFATDNMISKHPDIVARFLKGWFMTVAYMRSHKAETVHSIAPVLGESEAIVGRLYDNDMPAMSSNGAWDPAAVAVVAQSLVGLGLAETAPDPKTMLNSQFVPVKL
ncbi:MAG TPA: ABC transporter substrate-binding protein [Candidatus Lustribacter sp.]|nr:ABC transporter substrate-binding protein [Candidatus Lustribacter sp.]